MDQRPEPVPLGDAEIAANIARAAASGRAADRRPTPEQLVAAFGEPAATDEARRRAAAALAVAGVRVEPDLVSAPAGERVELRVEGSGAGSGGGARGRPGARRALAGLAAVAAVLAAGALAASLVGGDGGESVQDALPADTATTVLPPPTTMVSPPVTATTQTTEATVPDAETTTEPAETETQARTRTRTQRRPRRARRRQVTVRVDASARPTYLCVKDATGDELFAGELSGRRVFRGRVIRLNVGLASTVIKYRNTTVSLPGSPAGVVITRTGHSFLPLGQRPEC